MATPGQPPVVPAESSSPPPSKGGNKGGGKEKGKEGKKGKKGAKGKKVGAASKSSETERKIHNPEFFELVHPKFWPLASLWLTAIPTFDPDDCPQIPLIGQFMQDHASWFAIVFIFFAVLNVLSTLGVIVLCRRNKLSGGTTFKWTLQTLVIGFPSFMRLRSGETALKKKRAQQQQAQAEAASQASKKGGKKPPPPSEGEKPPPKK